jgi:Protein of unknown function (DUF1573)
MKDYIIIAVATVIGFACGAGSMYFIMRPAQNSANHIQAIPSGNNNGKSAFDTKNPDPEIHADNNKDQLTSVHFDLLKYDFGTLHDGDVVHTTFSFKNTGKKDLVIQNCVGSCGCTVPSWPHEAIAPGASAKIAVDFNSSGKSGVQHKTVTVLANTDPPNTILEITSNVIAK